MIYYQVQLQKLDGTWEAFGKALETVGAAQKRLCDYFLGHYGWSDQFKAIRIASVWQRWDEKWTVKEVVQYRDLT